MAKVRVGLVGCGFAAELHMHAYKRVYGVDVTVTAVALEGARHASKLRVNRRRPIHGMRPHDAAVCYDYRFPME